MQSKHCAVELSDAQLLARLVDGDNTAFEVLIQRYQPSLTRFVSSKVGSQETQDILQHVWLQLYRSLPTLVKPPPATSSNREWTLKAWIFRAAKNKCHAVYRKSLRSALLFSDLERNRDPEHMVLLLMMDPAPQPDCVAERQDLVSALNTLSPRARQICWLHLVHDLTFQEIGQRLHIRAGSAKMQFYKAKKALRKALSSWQIADTST